MRAFRTKCGPVHQRTKVLGGQNWPVSGCTDLGSDPRVSDFQGSLVSEIEPPVSWKSKKKWAPVAFLLLLE